MNLREAARGQPCLVRIPGVCNGNPETTILAHVGIAGTRGMGCKPSDLCGAWCCSSCHDVLDSRVKSTLSREYIKACAMDGVLRTLSYLSNGGQWSVRMGQLQWSPYR